MATDLAQLLRDEPSIGSNLLDAVSQLKVLQISKSAKLMVNTFEGILVPLVHHVEKTKAHEELVESNERFVKENLEVVVQATGNLSDTLATMEPTRQELEGHDKRVAEIQAQIYALNQEFEAISTRRAELINILAPAQSRAN